MLKQEITKTELKGRDFIGQSLFILFQSDYLLKNMKRYITRTSIKTEEVFNEIVSCLNKEFFKKKIGNLLLRQNKND